MRSGRLEKSLLDKYLSDSKILRMHAILHDAAGFVRETYNTGPHTAMFYRGNVTTA